MQRASQGVEVRPPRWRGPGAAWWAVAAIAVLVGVIWIFWPDAPAGHAAADARNAQSARSAGISPGWLLLGVLVAFALGWLVATALARAHRAAALREARSDALTLHQLLDVWHWQTDADHRLVRWQPPSGAPASAWVGRSAAQTLWERFDGDSAQALRERMHTAMPITDIDLVQAASLRGAGSAHWRLRGLARLGRDGRFDGYVGTARALEIERALACERSGLAAVLDELDTPAFILAAPGDEAATVHHVNAAAHALLDPAAARQAAQGALDAKALADALPDGLGDSVRDVLAGRPAEHANWQLRCRACDGDPSSGPAPLLLVLAARQAGAASAPADAAPSGSDEASDRESEHQAFSYTVSHDLRAPIRVVEGFARILKEDYGNALDRIGNDHVDRVLGAAARMNSMIDAMLALAHLSSQPLARQPVNLSQMAGFIVDDLRREQPHRRVNVTIRPNMTTHGDPTLLHMALENLIGNAWKYSSKRDSAELVFEAVQRDGRDVYVVADNGAGFDMRFADRLFGPFQRLHSANDFAGTGVGLASVRRIVRRHGGDIWAESEVGHGARFYFTLRADEASARAGKH